MADPPAIALWRPSIGDIVLVRARVHLIADKPAPRLEYYLRVIERVPRLYPQVWVDAADIINPL